jgi:hypothetical protein
MTDAMLVHRGAQARAQPGQLAATKPGRSTVMRAIVTSVTYLDGSWPRIGEAVPALLNR